MAGTSNERRDTPPDHEEVEADEIVVANEFTAVAVKKVRTRNGERLQIRSLSREHAIRLDALALEVLTWSDPLQVGHGLETPFGPDPGASDQAAPDQAEVAGRRSAQGNDETAPPRGER